jgi:hypothetical protein
LRATKGSGVLCLGTTTSLSKSIFNYASELWKYLPYTVVTVNPDPTSTTGVSSSWMNLDYFHEPERFLTNGFPMEQTARFAITSPKGTFVGTGTASTQRDTRPADSLVEPAESRQPDKGGILLGVSLTRDWRNAVKACGFDPRPTVYYLHHCRQTNAMRSGVHPAIADIIVEHGNRKQDVQSLYLSISDADLPEAIDAM